MPEKDIHAVVGKAVISPEYWKKLLDPKRRASALADFPDLSQEERDRILAIQETDLAGLAKGCLNLINEIRARQKLPPIG